MTTTEKITRRTPIAADVIDSTFSNPTISRSYNKQFNSLYTFRSKELRSRVMKLAMPKWSDVEVNGSTPKFVSKVLDVPFLKPVFIIGTTLADMKFKPDVLKEVELNVQGHFKELDDLTNTAGTGSKIDDLRKSSYSDPATDKIWLEDESGRILLTGDLLNEKILVTGLVIGVLGIEIESGVFHVVDIVYPEAAPQLSIKSQNNIPGKLLLSSGFNLNRESSLDKFEILKNWIMGDLCDQRANDISEFIIVGNSVDISVNKSKQVDVKNKYTESFNSQYDENSVKYLDSYISVLLQSIPISILPGSNDIVETGLPKQPLHKSLLARSSNKSNFRRLTDPVFYEINGVRILITSGENINDIMKYIIPNIKVNEEIDESIYNDSRLRVIEDSLLWQIIAPTAPDTLWCYPFEDKDPFTLVETPHVYIVGNQPKYETSLIELRRKNGDILPVRVISLPEFSKTSSCVLLDLQSLNCQLVKFNAS